MQISARYEFKSVLAATHFFDAIQMRMCLSPGFQASATHYTVAISLKTTNLVLVSHLIGWLNEYFDEVGGIFTYPQFDLDAVHN